MKVICYHGSPGSADDFGLFRAAFTDLPVECISRKGYPGHQPVDTAGAVLMGYSWGCVDAIRAAMDGPRPAAVLLISPYLFAKKVSPLKSALLSTPGVGTALLKK